MRIGSDPNRIQLPPAEQLDRLPEEIAKAGREVADLREKHEAERRNLVEFENARAGAEQIDTQAAADALRAGKPDPGRKVTDKAEKAIAAQKPKVGALGVAVADAERDLRAAIAKHAEEQRTKLGDEVDTQRAEALTIVEELVEKIGERQASFALKAWLADPTRQFNPGSYGRHLTDLQRPNGEQIPVDAVAATLLGAFAPPTPPARSRRSNRSCRSCVDRTRFTTSCCGQGAMPAPR
jgi:hypothetical protein